MLCVNWPLQVKNVKNALHENLTIYSPLAHRLGIAQLKWELKICFRYLAPERYKEIARC
jgi:(p)ppGpp synthase/HD superfamily hydrolase